jgi:hypothetical protein
MKKYTDMTEWLDHKTPLTKADVLKQSTIQVCFGAIHRGGEISTLALGT